MDYMFAIYKTRLTRVSENHTRRRNIPLPIGDRRSYIPFIYLIFKLIQTIPKTAMSDATRLSLHVELLGFRTQAVYPEYLDLPESTELRVQMSPFNLLSNLIRSKRAKRTRKAAGIGYPFSRNDSVDLVGEDLTYLAFSLHGDARSGYISLSLSHRHAWKLIDSLRRRSKTLTSMRREIFISQDH